MLMHKVLDIDQKSFKHRSKVIFIWLWVTFCSGLFSTAFSQFLYHSPSFLGDSSHVLLNMACPIFLFSGANGGLGQQVHPWDWHYILKDFIYRCCWWVMELLCGSSMFGQFWEVNYQRSCLFLCKFKTAVWFMVSSRPAAHSLKWMNFVHH